MKINSCSKKTAYILAYILAYIVILTISATLTFAQPSALDTTFGTGGVVTTNVSTADDEIFATAIQSDGKIVTAGYSESPAQFTIARYSTNGTLDSSFGTGGIVKTAFVSTNLSSPNVNVPAYANAVIIQSDGKIVAGGVADDKFTLVRYNTNGTLDTAFGSQGKVQTPIGVISSIEGLVIQSDGKIVAAGYTEYLADFAVARYTTGGVLDSSFGSSGIVTTDFFGDDDRATSIKLQSDGKIVVGGGAVDYDLFLESAVARYNTNGTLDTNFNGSGIAANFIACGSDPSAGCRINALDIQSGGKIVASGSGEDIYVSRYNTNGSFDTSFGTNGIVITNLGGSYDNANDLIIDTGGSIIVNGSIISKGNEDIAVAKYLSSGVLDTTFDNGDGIETYSLGTNSDISYSISIQSGGKVVISGSNGNFGNKQFATIRLTGLQATAANASITGRVVTSGGSGIPFARVSLTNSQGNVFYTQSNSFGYYTFSNFPVGQTYILTVSAKGYTFNQSSQVINLMDDYTAPNFVAN